MTPEERDLLRLRAKWDQAWTEIREHMPEIQRIAMGGAVALDEDGPLIQKVFALVAGEWHRREAEATLPGNE